MEMNMVKTLKLGQLLSSTLLKPGVTVVNHHPRGREESKTNLVKSNHKKSQVCLKITMQREHEGSSLNSCVVSRKPRLSDASQEKKGLHFARSIKIGLWSDGERSCGSDESRLKLFHSDGTIRVTRDKLRTGSRFS